MEGCKVFLTYLDDGGKDGIKVFGGVIVPMPWFTNFESSSAVVIAKLLPDERRETFDEFHASDLYAGTKTFEGLPEEGRYAAICELLQERARYSLTYVYSAIDMRRLQRAPVRSASWLDTAFFMCVRKIDELLRHQGFRNIEQWHKGHVMGITPAWPLNVMILDEPGNAADKHKIRSTFRLMRQTVVRSMRPIPGGGFQHSSETACQLDDLFFGSSADSIGLQVADVCNWVMWRYLRDRVEDDFYKALMKGDVVCAKHEPEWSDYRHLFLTHDDAPPSA